MRKFLSFLFALFTLTSISQTFTPDMDNVDSLAGFNTAEVINYAKQNGVQGKELRDYVKQRQRDFVRDRYYKSNPIHEAPINGKLLGNPGQVMVAPCVNEGFENTAPGTYNGAANAFAVQGWTLYGNYATNAGYNCNALGTPYNLGANEFGIVTTPLNFNAELYASNAETGLKADRV